VICRLASALPSLRRWVSLSVFGLMQEVLYG